MALLDPGITEALQRSDFISAVMNTTEGEIALMICRVPADSSLAGSARPLAISLELRALLEATGSVLRFGLRIDDEDQGTSTTFGTYIDPNDTHITSLLQNLIHNQKYYFGLATVGTLDQAIIRPVKILDPDFGKNLEDILDLTKRHNKSIPRKKLDFETARRDAIGN